jgi:hypothetical protein
MMLLNYLFKLIYNIYFFFVNDALMRKGNLSSNLLPFAFSIPPGKSIQSRGSRSTLLLVMAE